MLLKDKVVIVKGSARGIGKVYAKRIATEGGKVVRRRSQSGDTILNCAKAWKLGVGS